jgi:hypothetical protein
VRSLGIPFMDEGISRVFLNDPLLEDVGITEPEQKPDTNNDRIANWTLSFKRSLFKLWLVGIPGCDRC